MVTIPTMVTIKDYNTNNKIYIYIYICFQRKQSVLLQMLTHSVPPVTCRGIQLQWLLSELHHTATSAHPLPASSVLPQSSYPGERTHAVCVHNLFHSIFKVPHKSTLYKSLGQL